MKGSSLLTTIFLTLPPVNLLFPYTGTVAYLGLAKDAMRCLAANPVVDGLPASSALLADLEIGSEPLHLTVVGRKDDPASQNLFDAASRYPSAYKRLEWWDTKEGLLPNPDVQYPQLKTRRSLHLHELPVFAAHF